MFDGWVVRELNAHIHRAAVGFVRAGGEDFPTTFYCECGCGGQLEMTVADFDADAGDARLTGHEHAPLPAAV